MGAPRLLLVDDSEAIQLTMGALLEDAGFAVQSAVSLAEARVALRRGAIDLAILDMHLSDGLGTELIPDLRQAAPAARVVVMSGESAPGTIPGADLVLEKSTSPDDVVTRLMALLRAEPGS
jgi:DNA-binding response OmpR family regulator